MQYQGWYSQHFIFFVEWAQYARVLRYFRLKMLAEDKHSSLFSPFVIHDENEVLWIRPRVPIKKLLV